MHNLYPSIQAFKKHSLKIDDVHTLSFDESGNAEGIPILFLHGGPGNGCNHHSRRYFDPNLYRIITLDQRGCGQSLPHGHLENNNTQALLDDLEKIRYHLKINRWILFGDGWGATLALLYAIQYTDQVCAIIASGLSLGDQKSIDWLYKNGIRRIFPDYWKQFTEKLTKKEKEDPLASYYHYLTHEKNELVCMSLAKEWGLWVTRCSTLRPNQEAIDLYQEAHRALAMAKISTHFAMNQFFIPDQFISQNIQTISHIPSILVHGRYDMISPIDSVFELSERWHASQCHIVRDAGHSIHEPGIQDVLIRATIEFSQRFKSVLDFQETS